MHKNVVYLIFSVLILPLFVQVVHASGRQEDPIRLARQLVNENRINDAILLLEQTVREDPERIQQAEALLRTIREIRGEYNVLFDQLIDNLVNNPDDIERTLEIIDQMEALDEFPNERVVSQIDDARIVAQLAYDRNLVNARMDEALSLLQQQLYGEAIGIYLSLRELQRDRFNARGYGDIFVNSVDRMVAQVPSLANDFENGFPPYRTAGQTVGAGESSAADEAALAVFFSEAEQFSSVVSTASDLAGDVSILKSQVPLQFPDDPVDWFLNFQEIIIRGRSEYRGEEGIVYAIQQAYRESTAPLIARAREQTVSLVERGQQAASAEQFDRAREDFETANQTAVLWQRAEAALIGIFATRLAPLEIAELRGPNDAVPVITASGHVEALQSLSSMSGIMTPFVETGGTRADSIFSLQSQKASTEGIVSNLETGRTDWNESLAQFEPLPESYRSVELVSLLEETTAWWDRSVERGITREREIARRIAQLRTEAIPAAVSEYTIELAAVAPLVEGLEEEILGSDGGVRVSRYTDQALQRYEALLTAVTQDRETIGNAREELAGEADYVRESDIIRQEQIRLATLESQLDNLLLDAEEGLQETRQLIARSEELIQDALERTRDMRAAIAALQVDAARNNFEAVREAYFESLELRENAAFRQDVDARIQQLGEELQELENVIVVRRVRELITAANNLYNQDEYVSARDTLLEAQQTWEQTNVEANTEIDRLLRLVTAALSLEEGRVLAITDPLYPILSNYLSIAREDFNRAVELRDSGSEIQSSRLFDRAIENLRNVRDVRPLNWDARILELRIAQIRNADDFDSVFASRYEQALSRLPEVGPLEVYGELEVLAEINPDYPGIQDQIRRLEIALNLRPDPVDQARVARANDLYRRAQSLSGGSLDQITVAVSLLEQALEINPTNNQATFLLDQLRIRLGGQATVALATGDEQQYRRAETLFSQGQVLQALSIVERLLQDSGNQNYPPLVDLRRRIALRLGI